jgi:hypothetical protein
MSIRYRGNEGFGLPVIIIVILIVAAFTVAVIMYTDEDDSANIDSCDQEGICNDELSFCQNTCLPPSEGICIEECRDGFERCMAMTCNTAEQGLTIVEESGAGEIKDRWAKHASCNALRWSCEEPCRQMSLVKPDPGDSNSWVAFEESLQEGSACYKSCDKEYLKCEEGHSHASEGKKLLHPNMNFTLRRLP